MPFEKANFDDIYDCPDPAKYLRVLGDLEYRKNDFVFDPLLKKIASIKAKKGECTILDLACSYGFNGCIAKYGLPYGASILTKPHVNDRSCRVIGLDISKNALSYAYENAFVDDCINQNLEIEDLDEKYRSTVDAADLVIASGAFSYIGLETIKRVLDSPKNSADFVGWPICSCEKSELVEYLKSIFKCVEVSSKPLPMRKFRDVIERREYVNEIIKINQKLSDAFLNRICVFKISANERK